MFLFECFRPLCWFALVHPRCFSFDVAGLLRQAVVAVAVDVVTPTPFNRYRQGCDRGRGKSIKEHGNSMNIGSQQEMPASSTAHARSHTHTNTFPLLCASSEIPSDTHLNLSPLCVHTHKHSYTPPVLLLHCIRGIAARIQSGTCCSEGPFSPFSLLVGQLSRAEPPGGPPGDPSTGAMENLMSSHFTLFKTETRAKFKVFFISWNL